MGIAPHIAKAQKHDRRVNIFVTSIIWFVSVMFFVGAFIVVGYLTNGIIATAIFSVIGSVIVYKIVNRDK